jgi:tungstate transport system substrate-binding protein
MSKKLVRLGILLALALSLTFLACGGEGEEEGQASPTPATTEAAPTAEEPTEGPTPVVRSGPEEVILATTTSVYDTGLLDALASKFEDETGYNLKPIAVGTGQALAMGERGDADVMFVHAPAAEKELIDSGAAIDRRLVAHNYFLLLGPESDPAGAKTAASAADALTAIYESESAFVSRGDDSGTHKKEMSLWEKAALDPKGQDWYSEAGQGMSATLQIANQRDAYTICDKGTYLFSKQNIELVVIFEDDPAFLNVYSVMLVNPDKHDAVNYDGAKAFADFLVSEEVQELIGEFGVEEYGEQLFVPDADKTYADLGLE